MFKNEQLINELDIAALGIVFDEKPLLIGGLAMTYYGIRKQGNDVDFIVTDKDYHALAAQHPENQRDKWGDLILSVNHYEFLRSIFRLDYAFFAEGAIEYPQCKVISLEKLFFMKVLAVDNQPEVSKHVQDYRLMLKYILQSFQNDEYAAQAEKKVPEYLEAPDGIIHLR